MAETNAVIDTGIDTEMTAGIEMSAVDGDIVRTEEKENTVLVGERAIHTGIIATGMMNAGLVVINAEKTTAMAATAVAGTMVIEKTTAIPVATAAQTIVTETTAVTTEEPHRTSNAPHHRGENRLNGCNNDDDQSSGI